MRQLPVFVALLFLWQPAVAQVYINDDVLIAEGSGLHTDGSIRVSSSATVYDRGSLQSQGIVSVADGNYIRIGDKGLVVTTLPGGQASDLDIGISSNNRITLQPPGNQPVAYAVGLGEGVYDNPETGQLPATARIVNRTWQLTSAQAGAPAITLAWNTADELSFNRTNNTIATWQSSSDTGWNYHAYTAANYTGGSPAYTQTLNPNLQAGVVYYLHITDKKTTTPPPPVPPFSWLLFTATPVDKDVRLDWKVATEPGNFYSIERADDRDSTAFATIGSVKPQTLSTTERSYDYWDRGAMTTTASKLYYRLAHIRPDGLSEYSEIRTIIKDAPGTFFSLYPNPATNTIHYSFYTEPGLCAIVLHDLAGRRVYSRQYEVDKDVVSGTIDASTWASGMYTMTLVRAGEQVETRKLVLQRR